MKRVLFFDDYPRAVENRDLVERLERAGFHVTRVKTTREFESAVRWIAYDTIIMDVMAKPSGPMHQYDDPDVIVEETTCGIELLRRCRGGYYKRHAKHYQSIPIYIRTANGAHHMQKLYKKEGGIYIDPAENRALVKMINEYIATREKPQ